MSATLVSGNKDAVSLDRPYRVSFRLTGIKPILFHAYKPEAVELKAKSAKGSKAKKEDQPEDYVYRDENGVLAIPGLNIHACLIEQGRSRQDPRSPRKSARDLMKAAICPDDDLAVFSGPGGPASSWDFLDTRRVCMNGKSAITRVRPGLLKGWEIIANFTVLLPQYVEPEWLLGLINDAGAYQGLGDFRPVFGRFQCSSFEVLKD